jgi:hypothetical protein
VLDDPNARTEDDVYRELSASWAQLAVLVKKVAEKMSAQHELPMGAHDETKWTEAHMQAFEKFVNGQSRVLSLLRAAAERDEAMLASMQKPE